MGDEPGEAASEPLQLYVWRHSKRASSWSMLEEPEICGESYQAAQVVVLAHSEWEALALLEADGRWNAAELGRLPPEVVPLSTPRILTWQIDPF